VTVDEDKHALVHLVTMATADGSAAWMTMTRDEAARLGTAVLKVYDTRYIARVIRTESEEYEIRGYPGEDVFVVFGSWWHVELSGRQARAFGEALVRFGKEEGRGR